MRAFLTLSASLVTAAAVYAIPVIFEIALFHLGLNPWLICVLFADVPGSILLFALGFRRLALTVYLATTALEALLLCFGLVPAESLVWITNIVPAAISAIIMFKAALRWLVIGEQSII